MGIEWYVARDGKTFGPFTSERMNTGVREGELRRDDHVWCKGMPHWLPAADVPEIWQPPSPPPPPVPAAPRPEPKSVQATAAEDRAPANKPIDDGGHVGAELTALPRTGLIVRH